MSGRARTTTSCRLAPPALLIADGSAWRRLAAVAGTPLLAAGPEAPAFAVDFEVPLHLAIDGGAWWLEPGPPVQDAARVGRLAARVAALGEEVAALRERAEREPAAGSVVGVPPAAARRTAAPSPPPQGAPAAPPAAARHAADPPREARAPAAAPTPRATPVPRPRLHPLRALRPTLPVLLVAAGALAFSDAVATVTWQEPISALWAAHQQHGLESDLAQLDRTFNATVPPPAAASATQPAPTPQDRMRTLAAALERRTTGGHPLGEIRIPRIDAHYVVVQGTGTASLRRGPGHYPGTPLPGEAGTVGIAGHRTTYGAPFRHLDALRRGDAIDVTMPYGHFTYRVEGTRIVR
ncbi:MAG TPA: class E sortase, partial [Baekduia sp.]